MPTGFFKASSVAVSLLKVFVAANADIAEEVRGERLGHSLWTEPDECDRHCRAGIVTLTGRMHRRGDARLQRRVTPPGERGRRRDRRSGVGRRRHSGLDRTVKTPVRAITTRQAVTVTALL